MRLRSEWCGWRRRRILTSTAGKCIDHIPNDKTADDADNGGQGNGSRSFAEGNAANKHHSLYTFTEDGDQGQDKQGPLPSLGTSVNGCRTDALKKPRGRKRIDH